MTKQPKNLGELELAVLNEVWEKPGSTVQEIAEIMAKQRDCARTTVLTVMQRLHTKGYLTREKVDGVFRYTPTKERGVVVSDLIGQFVKRVMDGSTAPFLAYLANAPDLTTEQADQLREIVEELERNDEEE